jgi:anion-transporting  ArsA/GET3 family ATPase
VTSGGGPGAVPGADGEGAAASRRAGARSENRRSADTPPEASGRTAGGGILAQLVTRCQIIICAGPGGVGKTTTAAALALQAARLGRRACVVTIDPAKRLADALGLDELTNEPHQVDGDWRPAGELWAMMLDTKTTFDDVVVRNAGSPEQADAILGNRLYRNISGALGGTQEYMAMEKLYELHHEGRFDLVVVDTPPTRHALDFLDAPARLTRFLDNRVFRLLMTPTRAGLRAIGLATQMFLRTISRVVGGAIVTDAVAFFAAFEGMEQGFRDRAAKVEKLLGDATTAFVVVSSPRRDAVEETVFFADRLRDSSGRVEALVVNRMFPTFGPVPAALRPRPGDRAGPAEGLAALATNLADLERVAGREREHVSALSARLPGAEVVQVPFLADDVHDVGGLTEVCRWLFDQER